MALVDARAAREFGVPALLLMENAGRAVAERSAIRLPRPGDRVVIVCGKGNNGGDGFAAARHLAARGASVRCVLAADRETLTGDARTNLDIALRWNIPVDPLPSDHLPDAELYVDALLGTGSRGAPRGPAALAIRALARRAEPVVAIDVPSGVDADTGFAHPDHVRAVETVMFGLPKAGLLQQPGRRLAGDLVLAHIGLPPPLLASTEFRIEAVTGPRAAPGWAPRSVDAHKGDAGRLLIVAGAPGLTGAAALCSAAALRAGAGLVTVAAPRSLVPILEVKTTEAMTLGVAENEDGSLAAEAASLLIERAQASDAVAIGPGLGRSSETETAVRRLLASATVPLVIDADGLNLLAPADGNTFPGNSVITPHPGELARLLGTTVPCVQSNRMEAVRTAAARFGCVVLLKGPSTLISRPDGKVAINTSGSAALATGGSGDVLTGIVGACLARGIPAYEAAIAAVFLHGLAGELATARLGAPGTLAGDVERLLPEAIRWVQTNRVPLPWHMTG
jgi:NAD(P)H-hydrate epimerase